MSVINTQSWLQAYIRVCKTNQVDSEFSIQEKILCEPLAHYFPQFTVQELHQILMYGGLFAPIYYEQVALRIDNMKKRNIWGLVEKELALLKEDWQGEDVNIFIFPINKEEVFFTKELEGKNGLAYEDKIILFIDEEAPTSTIQTLLTHEYNHVCRLRYLKKDTSSLSLKDSLITEGLAEMAVKLRFGKDAAAKFTNKYTKHEAKQYWKAYIQDHLQVTDVDEHQRFLFGDEQIPNRLGYCIGFIIIEEYLQKHKGMSMKELLSISTDDFLHDSSFQEKE